MPNLVKGSSYNKIELINAEGHNTFSDYMCYHISDEGLAVAKTSERWNKSTLSLNIAPLNFKSGKYNFYMSCFPTKTGRFIVKATTTDGKSYYYNQVFSSKEFCAGKAYIINCNKQENWRYEIMPDKYKEPEFTENGFEYVDLYTPGVYWATTNVGAAVPADMGVSYAWGETIGIGFRTYDGGSEANCNPWYCRDNYKSAFTWEQYKWNVNNQFVKYGAKNTSGGISEYELVTLGKNDDAANKIWGGTWHTPSKSNFYSLLHWCYWRYTEKYMGKDGQTGYIVFRSKHRSDDGMLEKNGEYSYILPNDWGVNPAKRSAEYDEKEDVHIFLPNLGNDDLFGRYMTTNTGWNPNSPEKWNDVYYVLHFNDKTQVPDLSTIQVYLGSVIRPVCDRNDGR